MGRLTPVATVAPSFAGKHRQIEADVVSDDDTPGQGRQNVVVSLRNGRRACNLRIVDAMDGDGAGRDGHAGIDQRIEDRRLDHAETRGNPDRRDRHDAIPARVEAGGLAIDRHHGQAFERRVCRDAQPLERLRLAEIAIEDIGDRHVAGLERSWTSAAVSSRRGNRSLNEIRPKVIAAPRTARSSLRFLEWTGALLWIIAPVL